MDKMSILRDISIGNGVAEQEAESLSAYFVETDQWNKIVRGDIDIVYGQKGAGKSALFSFLNSKEYDFISKNILIVSASNMRGESIFSDLKSSPPPSETSFVYLWKIYILVLLASKIRDYGINNKESLKLQIALEEAGLLPRSNSIPSIFSSVKAWLINKWNRKATEVSYAIEITPDGPVATRTARYEGDENEASIPVNSLLAIANSALQEHGMYAWVLFDRLDVAFSDTAELEENALRALFRVYLDLLEHDYIKTKIFVRDDIWARIVGKGFREASHIVKKTTISWDNDGLLNLLFYRLLNNETFTREYNIDKGHILSSADAQKETFYKISPEKVSTGKNPETFDWIVSRIADGKKISTPRDLVNFFNQLIAKQIEAIEKGNAIPQGDKLFDRSIFKHALSAVSETRYHQTLLAENPSLRDIIESLRAKKSEQNIETLAKLWDDHVPQDQVQLFADRLCDIGFFERRTSAGVVTYWVPFLYRDALQMVQGKAFSDEPHGEEED